MVRGVGAVESVFGGVGVVGDVIRCIGVVEDVVGGIVGDVDGGVVGDVVGGVSVFGGVVGDVVVGVVGCVFRDVLGGIPVGGVVESVVVGGVVIGVVGINEVDVTVDNFMVVDIIVVRGGEFETTNKDVRYSKYVKKYLFCRLINVLIRKQNFLYYISSFSMLLKVVAIPFTFIFSYLLIHQGNTLSKLNHMLLLNISITQFYKILVLII